MSVPENLRYTEEHEWIAEGEDGTIRVGITDYAQDQLGDVVFVEIMASGQLEKGAMLAEVESTKSVAEVYAPVSGEIVEVNTALAATPELVNSDPYGQAWFVVMRPDGSLDDAGFLDAAAYVALTE